MKFPVQCREKSHVEVGPKLINNLGKTSEWIVEAGAESPSMEPCGERELAMDMNKLLDRLHDTDPSVEMQD